MKELIDEMERETERELERANKTHPLFHSAYEAYGVMKKEIDEAHEEFIYAEVRFNDFYKDMRKDYTGAMFDCLIDIKKSAICGAAEMVQVAAMAQKAMDSLKTRG